MREIAIVLRYTRAVVSQRIETRRGPGRDACLNWPDLEAQTLEVIAHTMTDGPFVYPCPSELARQALFGESESES